ncbi:expressed unknown protein [Seminavis robusta]|uniref:PDZ domain-containing protein n=1 Tax=Seminavis robusta TaxID=568900 RepID=A0A9N8D4F8_9STRA|nr:expressed unknown protein [Seminavis robusta]|eukprot:Sro2_g001530.1 n/a (900) ;mRNA; r:179959-182658
MPSFLSKLFRKKKGPDEGSTNASKGSSKKSRKSKKNKKVDNKQPTAPVAPASSAKKAVQQHAKQPSPRQPVSNSSNGAGPFSSGNNESRVLSPHNQVPNLMERANNEPGPHTMAGSPHHQQVKQHNSPVTNSHSKGWGGPVDLDESDLGSDTDENQVQTTRNGHNHPVQQQQQQRLSVQQLHRFDMQHQKRETPSHQFYMPKDEPARFSAGHVPVVDDMNRSDASSSSFNLSTDAEDTEYEALKRRGVVPNPTVLDSSHLSGVSSPTNYNTDGDNSIFPALQTDDEATLADRDSRADGILPAKSPGANSDDAGGALRMNAQGISSSSSSSQQKHAQLGRLSKSEDEDERAWTVSPTKDGANPFPFHNPASPTPRRNFTSPKMARSPTSFTNPPSATSQNDTSNEFANFADFSNVTFPADTESWGAPKSERVAVDGSPPPVSPGRKTHRPSNSAADMTLSDILAQAKGKHASTGGGGGRSTGSGGGGGGNRRVSASSVNSAPAITAKYLRQHHNLRPVRPSGDQDGTTPVSDIIDSLEMANASRASHHSTGGGSSKSVTQPSYRDSSRSAKDRMRDRRRRGDKEYSSSRRRGDPNHPTESSDGSDQEASESWLFDEVTGALGPRGIAADLESLSGRSKSSSGNKSHKSHRSHRSHRSHGRSRRRKSSKNHQHPSSGESVDSRGSRHSRGSRYSHRSTRSYLSQMSEQSRSVANDLLRLEMQLAMVGSQDNNAATATAAAGSSASVASRASRKSRSSARRTVAIARRNKVTIQAPPGKLGIILANKADSKGTVVSGVRSSSVLSEKISPGDRIVAIDGEDVSLMTVSEITTIMARKSDFERTLTVLTTPKHLSMPSSSSSGTQPSAADGAMRNGGMSSPSKSSTKDYDSYHNHNRYSNSGR